MVTDEVTVDCLITYTHIVATEIWSMHYVVLVLISCCPKAVLMLPSYCPHVVLSCLHDSSCCPKAVIMLPSYSPHTVLCCLHDSSCFTPTKAWLSEWLQTESSINHVSLCWYLIMKTTASQLCTSMQQTIWLSLISVPQHLKPHIYQLLTMLWNHTYIKFWQWRFLLPRN